MSAIDIPASVRGELVALLHLILAVGVTVHVLLTKREAGSSVAWIGLAWLAPIMGSVLYLLLGINRVRRRAQSLHRPRRRPERTRNAQRHVPTTWPPWSTPANRLRVAPPKTATRSSYSRTATMPIRRCWPPSRGNAIHRPFQLHLSRRRAGNPFIEALTAQRSAA